MSISALGNNWWLSLASNAITGLTGSKSASATESASSAASTDPFGEAFQLSLSGAQTQNAVSNVNLKEDIGAFLSKVANGTVSSDDLQKMQLELQQAQQSGQIHGHHHRHHHHAQNEVNSQANQALSSINADLKTFLDKLLKGTATSDDFKNIEAQIASLKDNSNINAITSATQSSASEILRVGAASRSALNAAINAYNSQAYFGSNQSQV